MTVNVFSDSIDFADCYQSGEFIKFVKFVPGETIAIPDPTTEVAMELYFWCDGSHYAECKVALNSKGATANQHQFFKYKASSTAETIVVRKGASLKVFWGAAAQRWFVLNYNPVLWTGSNGAFHWSERGDGRVRIWSDDAITIPVLGTATVQFPDMTTAGVVGPPEGPSISKPFRLADGKYKVSFTAETGTINPQWAQIGGPVAVTTLGGSSDRTAGFVLMNPSDQYAITGRWHIESAVLDYDILSPIA